MLAEECVKFKLKETDSFIYHTFIYKTAMKLIRKGRKMLVTHPWIGVSGPILGVARDALGGSFMNRRILSGGGARAMRHSRRVRRGKGFRAIGSGFVPL